MTLPRRSRPTTQRRVNNSLATHATQSLGGATLSARPWDGRGRSVQDSERAYVQVEHGDDPDVPRPLAKTVRWVGAAEPNNATETDDWYPANPS